MKTCLIVDDSKVVRMVARKILEGLNFEIAEAEDGQQALDACMEKMPAAVLLDWNMPVKNGLEFLQDLRALDDVDQPIVVFCTTENDMTHIQEAIQAGANEPDRAGRKGCPGWPLAPPRDRPRQGRSCPPRARSGRDRRGAGRWPPPVRQTSSTAGPPR